MLRLTKRSVVTAAIPLVALAAGCPAPVTRIVVVVDSNLRVPGELSSLAVRVCPVVGDEACPMSTRVDTIPLGAEGGGHALPVSFEVVPSASRRAPASAGYVLIEVVGSGPDASRGTVRRTARLAFADGRTAVLPMYLSRACLRADDPCGHASASTCRSSDGACVPDLAIDGRDYVTGDPLRPGAEFDVRLPDASAPGDVASDAPADARGDAPGDGDVVSDASTDAPPVMDAGDAGCTPCGDRCVDVQSDPYNCGRCDNACAPANNTTAACTAGRCQQILCAPGFDDCNGDKDLDGCEVDLRVDPTNCGRCTVACPPSAAGARVCSGAPGAMACGLDCNTGYALSGDVCVSGPTLLAPVSGSVVSRRDPSFSFNVPPGTSAEIELCPGERDCSVPTRVNSPSPSTVRAAVLTSGAWFWRVRGRRSDGRYTEYTPWWQFFVPAVTSGAAERPDGFTGVRYDANMDGRTDLAVSAVSNRTAPPGGAPRDFALFYAGASAERIRPTPDAVGTASRAYASMGFAGGDAGDVNGDGFSDVAFTSTRGLVVFHGGPGGMATAPRSAFAVVSEMMTPTFYFAGSAGDTNRDGYGDVLVAASDTSALYLYLGGPGGLSALRRTMLRDTAPFTVGAVRAGFDANGDGIGDVVAASRDSNAISLWLSGSTGLLGSTSPTPVGASSVGAEARAQALCTGDVNGDGYADLIAGYPNADADAGRVVVYFGAATDPFMGRVTRPATILGSEIGAPGGRLGLALASADFDDDGFDDIVASMPGAGTVLVFRGAAAGVVPGAWAMLTAPGRAGIGYGLAVSTNFDGTGLPTIFALHGSDPALFTTFRGLGEASRVPVLRALVLAGPGEPGDYKFARAFTR